MITKQVLQLAITFIFSSPMFGQFAALPPFTIDLEPVSSTIPGVHSFAFAQSGSKWLIVGGRINGLHGFSSNDGFPVEYANNEIIVVDTVNWQSYASSLNVLLPALADPLRSTNMQFYQDGNYLYMVGGFGFDSVLFDYVTFPTITAIHVDDMINAVIGATPIAAHIRQVVNTNLRICGGELFKLGSDYHLIMGHNFQGYYTNPPTPFFTQLYSNQDRKFTLTDDGITLTVSNFINTTDTVNLHRRDLNVFPVVNPDESFSLGCYGGVFRYNQNLPFLNPVYITNSGITVDTYQQVMSHYTSAGFMIFDSILDRMHTTFLGGIGMYNYIPSNNTVVVDSLVPFISDITTLTKNANGQSEECVLPVQLPGLLGCNAEFALNENLFRYSNGVIKFRSLSNQRTLAGYMFGGIRATGANVSPSSANDSVYRIFITPDLTVGTPEFEQLELENIAIYPNPANKFVTIAYKSNVDDPVGIQLFNTSGQLLFSTIERKGRGRHFIHLEMKFLEPGLYFVTLSANTANRTFKIVKAE